MGRLTEEMGRLTEEMGRLTEEMGRLNGKTNGSLKALDNEWDGNESNISTVN